MSDITFYSWLIIANTWFAASHCTDSNGGRVFCNVVGLVWVAMAVFGKLVN